jgi:hypothetical protein
LFYQGSYHNGPIYISTNAGGSWTQTSAPAKTWTSVASSADGARLVAVANGGGIFTWQADTRPSLYITPLTNEIRLSWTVPSRPLMLQETSDLNATNWSEVTSPSVLNLTNLQNQVSIRPANRVSFYRLKSQ